MKLPSFIEKYLQRKKGLKEYQERIKSFLQDGQISVEENSKMSDLQKEFGLSEIDANKIHKNALSGVFKDMSTDMRITEEEKKSFEKLLDHFNLTTKDIDFNQSNFNKYHSLALIDKGILPIINNPEQQINLIFKEGEILHWGISGHLMKRKRVTTKVNYGGLGFSVKIMKGVRYRAGSMNVGSQSREFLAQDDSGIFYITNQRVGYLGYRKQFSFPFKKIGSFELRSDGLHIFKDGKEAPYILELDDYDVSLSIISFLINK